MGLWFVPLLLVVLVSVGIAMRLAIIQSKGAAMLFVMVQFGLGNETSFDVGWEER